MIVYAPVAHWVWGHGWLADRGTIDFAGGIVVHTTAGMSALVCAVMVGPRRGFPDNLIPPHSPGLTMAGAGMLWFGWFGFNGGSALAAGGTAAMAILATHCAAAAAALTWMAIEWAGPAASRPRSGSSPARSPGWRRSRRPRAMSGRWGRWRSGSRPARCAFSPPAFIKRRLKIDDTLDVFAVHGVGGMLGSLLVAVFARRTARRGRLCAGHDHGGAIQGAGRSAVAVVALWSGLASLVLIKLLALFVPLQDQRRRRNRRARPRHAWRTRLRSRVT